MQTEQVRIVTLTKLPAGRAVGYNGQAIYDSKVLAPKEHGSLAKA